MDGLFWKRRNIAGAINYDMLHTICKMDLKIVLFIPLLKISGLVC
jgi:hypothetical protein